MKWYSSPKSNTHHCPAQYQRLAGRLAPPRGFARILLFNAEPFRQGAGDAGQAGIGFPGLALAEGAPEKPDSRRIITRQNIVVGRAARWEEIIRLMVEELGFTKLRHNHGIGYEDSYALVRDDAVVFDLRPANVFATGDVAHAATDDQGNVAAMSCQHAMSLGRVAGHNAAAELVGLPLHPYSQPKYVTCLDLGSWGALYTEGWDRQVRLTGKEGKDLKREINTKWIYPPAADRKAVFAIANPDYVIVP